MFWGFYDRYLIALILFDFQWTCNREDSSCHLSIYQIYILEMKQKHTILVHATDSTEDIAEDLAHTVIC